MPFILKPSLSLMRVFINGLSPPSSPGREAGGRRRICVQPMGSGALFVLVLPRDMPLSESPATATAISDGFSSASAAPMPSIFMGEADILQCKRNGRGSAGKGNAMSENLKICLFFNRAHLQTSSFPPSLSSASTSRRWHLAPSTCRFSRRVYC